MKQSEAAQFWPLIKAWSEGKTLQIKSHNGIWTDMDEAKFDGVASDYRIKPEQREFYILLHPDYGVCGAGVFPVPSSTLYGTTAIKVREVLE